MTRLPKPSTPGPWDRIDIRSRPDSTAGWAVAIVNGVPHDMTYEDAAAIAALPEWIALADRYEAALRVIELHGCDLAAEIARRALDGDA